MIGENIHIFSELLSSGRLQWVVFYFFNESHLKQGTRGCSHKEGLSKARTHNILKKKMLMILLFFKDTYFLMSGIYCNFYKFFLIRSFGEFPFEICFQKTCWLYSNNFIQLISLLIKKCLLIMLKSRNYLT